MSRKAVENGGKRQEIILEAEKLFFEKGFDGVTIRELQRAVGCEVGLFYYYFKSKDEVFEVVFEKLASEWADAFEKIAEKYDEDSVLEELFKFVCRLGGGYEKKNLHWSVKAAVCQRVAEEIWPFVENIAGNPNVSAAIAFGGCRLAFEEGVKVDVKLKNINEIIESFAPSENKKTEEKSTNRGDISVVLL